VGPGICGGLAHPPHCSVIQGIGIQGQRAPERGLMEDHAGVAERIPRGLIRISGLLRDRREGPRRQAPRTTPGPGLSPVSDACPARARIRDGGQHRQQSHAL
jgi:hypothetical protein